MKIEITDLGNNAEGIGRFCDKVCFVPFSLPNEICEAEIIKQNKNFNFCKLKNIIKSSEDRIIPKCKYFYKCGGCNLQHYSYNKQLDFKTNLVQNCFNKNYKLSSTIVNKTISSNNYNYRNKMVFQVSLINNQTIIGMFENGSHNITEIDYCEISSLKINKALTKIKQYIKKYNINGYDNKIKKGYLKHILLRELDNKISLTFIVNENKNLFINLNELNIEEIYLNINKSDKEILSSNSKLIYGNKIVYNQDNLKLEINPNSFMQVNNHIKTEIYNDVLSFVDKKIVINAYSGAGLLSALLSKKSKFVYGIEINKNASLDADKMIKTNKIYNVKNICGDFLTVYPNVLKEINSSFTLVVDPPRSGVNVKILELINNTKNCADLVYISCNPSTLTRDLNLLSNFKIIKIQPYDMFPQTNHVETLVYLKNNKIN